MTETLRNLLAYLEAAPHAGYNLGWENLTTRKNAASQKKFRKSAERWKNNTLWEEANFFVCFYTVETLFTSVFAMHAFGQFTHCILVV